MHASGRPAGADPRLCRAAPPAPHMRARGPRPRARGRAKLDHDVLKYAVILVQNMDMRLTCGNPGTDVVNRPEIEESGAERQCGHVRWY